jgi:hypothetical protein
MPHQSDIFSDVYGGREGDWEQRVVAAEYNHVLNVRDAQAALVGQMLPALQAMARQYGAAVALGCVEKLNIELRQWVVSHADVRV